MLSPLLKYGFDGVVASSGGYVACRDEVIYDSPMTDEERDRMSRLLKENGIFRTIECVEGAFTDDDFKNFLREHANEGENSEMLRWQEQIEKDLNILPMEAYKGQAVYKMVVMSPSMESLEICREELKDDFSFCIQEPRGGFVNGEIISRRFDKGTGVLKVCEHLGIPLEDSVGFGDSMNDKEMMAFISQAKTSNSVAPATCSGSVRVVIWNFGSVISTTIPRSSKKPAKRQKRSFPWTRNLILNSTDL